MPVPDTAEHRRLVSPHASGVAPWRRWGRYVSDRAWGTVREDYSADGDAWDFLTHDMARSKAYRWGEDGDRRYLRPLSAAGVRAGVLERARSDSERALLRPDVTSEGNHGEDVKEYYFYLDNTPTHSYMKMLYKYPQAEFPYEQLVEENRARQAGGPEFELLDTGIFDDNRYFDVFIEYAKADAGRHLHPDRGVQSRTRRRADCTSSRISGFAIPGHGAVRLACAAADSARSAVGQRFVSAHGDDNEPSSCTTCRSTTSSGTRCLYGPAGGEPLFTDNETNGQASTGQGTHSRTPFMKDAFHRHIVHGEAAINPAAQGTKAASALSAMVPAGGSVVCACASTPTERRTPLDDVDALSRCAKPKPTNFTRRFIRRTPPTTKAGAAAGAGRAAVVQADVSVRRPLGWKATIPHAAAAESRKTIRNVHWRHLNSMRILSMPDKWEYPWFAAWDLAFQCVTLALVDPEFAKENLWLLLFEQFQHPNGQIPAYEWEFSDLNPPVHAWAVLARVQHGPHAHRQGATATFSRRCFHKLLINFAWWVNKVDSEGNNVFEGGFLGLDNITVVDRSEKLPNGAILEQSDATGWMGFFCLN